MAGWAIIALGYAIQNDAASILEIEDYNGEDDNTFDFESWNVDFNMLDSLFGQQPFRGNWKCGETQGILAVVCKNGRGSYSKS